MDARSRLAESQAELLRALSGQSPPPTGFDADHLRTAGDALRDKRLRTLLKTWPALQSVLGDRARTWFPPFAAAHPLAADGSRGDGLRFMEWLLAHAEVDDARRDEIATLLAGAGPARVRWVRARSIGWLLLRLPGMRPCALALSALRRS